MKDFFSKAKLFLKISGAIIGLLIKNPELIPKKHKHGAALLKLPDSQMYESVYLQNLDIVDSYADEETALSQTDPVRRTLFILSIYDMEIQCGGLCQFFVNSSRTLAPHILACLETVGATEHMQLFSGFVTDNAIDLFNLDSFRVPDVLEYAAQTKRYDFEKFNDRYTQLTPLQTYMVRYIRANPESF